ncbi:MAG: helix-turn-helix transcriptional regulator [Alphaproteobacteria bacterium]|nr:helix-turn-helix transcriptional regulator [Alphaproteobacteria bacterium]
MLRHPEIWSAIDRLAADRKLSASGLARRAGLDPTTFNKSKRIARDGRPRWPSTESIAKILSATGITFGEFVSYLGDQQTQPTSNVRRIPVIGYAQAGAQGYFDDAGYPTGTGWDELLFPDISDPNAYALQITGDSMAPVYRDGDTVIVSPATNIRRGDRVVLKTTNGEVMAKQLNRRGSRRIDLTSLNAEHGERTLSTDEVVFMHRIIWVSQ